MAATTTKVVQLTRKFKIGATLLDDPAPDLPPKDAVMLYASNFPFIATSTVSDPVLDGETLVFTVRKPEVQVKGLGAKPSRSGKRNAVQSRAASLDRRAGAKRAPSRRTPVEKAVAAVEHWATAPAFTPKSMPRWQQVLSFVHTLFERPAAPIRDAFAIPLA